MFRKMFLVVLVAMFVGPMAVNAATSADAYITVKCTATVSVELFNGGSSSAVESYGFGDISAGSVEVSASPIGVRNNSQGAICSWDLQVVSITGGSFDWEMGTEAGLNQIALFAKFSTTTLTSDDFDVVKDTMSLASYKGYTQDGAFYDEIEQYKEPAWTASGDDVTKILPTSYDNTSNGKAERHLWLRLDAPTAVSEQVEKTITLRILAGTAN